MYQRIARTAIVVADYDDAIAFYTEKLGFDLLEDTQLTATKRWVVIAPKGAKEGAILLAKAKNEQERASIGNQTGGRVFLFLFTDDFWRDYNTYRTRGVEFVREPMEEDYGTVSVFKDLYGNLWDLIEPKEEISNIEPTNN
jgi:catechol 2,3-dioxygenase-like lactoylglutathione lyase family enzyme